MQVLQASMSSQKRPSTLPSSAAHPPATMSMHRLHELFSFNPASTSYKNSSGMSSRSDVSKGEQSLQLRQLFKALSVIAGSSLQVLVVPDSRTAKQLLDNPSAFLVGASHSQVNVA